MTKNLFCAIIYAEGVFLMFWIDIVFIVLIILFALWGLKQGFLASLISLVGIALSVVLAVWLAPMFGSFVDNIFGGSISKMFTDMMTNVVSNFGSLDYEVADATKASTLIDSFNVSGVLKSLLVIMLGGKTIASGQNVQAWFSGQLGGLVTTVCAAVLLFLLIRIALALLSKLFDKITENRAINGLDRVLGFAFGAVKGLIYVAGVIAIINLLCVVPASNDVVTKWLDKTTLLNDYAKWIFELLDNFTGKYNL